MEKPTARDINRNISITNTGLLLLVSFFLGRLVIQFDQVAENVSHMTNEVAVIKSTVERHDREIESIKTSALYLGAELKKKD